MDVKLPFPPALEIALQARVVCRRVLAHWDEKILIPVAHVAERRGILGGEQVSDDVGKLL